MSIDYYPINGIGVKVKINQSLKNIIRVDHDNSIDGYFNTILKNTGCIYAQYCRKDDYGIDCAVFIPDNTLIEDIVSELRKVVKTLRDNHLIVKFEDNGHLTIKDVIIDEMYIG